MNPGLYVIGTPIGNRGDMTKRAEETLRSVDVILAEDTRHSGILLKSLDISKPMISCHKFNEASRTEQVIQKIKSGMAVGLISNAGMPAISDPGARIVAACRGQALPVTVIPGPCSVSSALSISGIDADRYFFEGFLPVKPARKKKRLKELASLPCPVVIFESPYRCIKLLEILNEIMQNRQVFVLRELTKLNEECVDGTPSELIEKFQAGNGNASARRIKGEVILIIAKDDT